MLPNIILIGFMGSGKTSVGRHLAALTGHRFVDTDALIMEKVGMGIPDIFREQGEEAFRDWESSVLRDLVGVYGVVLATGGGLILREENRRLLHEIGIPVWLDASDDVLFSRVSRNRKRPLLATDNPRESFDRLRQERKGIYEQASALRVDSSELSHEEAARKVLEEAMRLHRQSRS
jgi:shikimate kinase